MMNFSGQSLQRTYQECGGKINKNEEKRELKDRQALHKARKQQSWKTTAIQERMDERDDNRKSLDELIKEEIARIPNKQNMKIADIQRRAKITVEIRLKEAKEKTNRLARKHGLELPNNPEAVKHDRFHCYSCGGKLHIPDAYKELDDSVKGLFDDETVKHLCCFCFVKEDLDINEGEATPDIRLAVYNPGESVKKNIDTKGKIENVKKMSDLQKISLKNKMKKYQNIINLVGNVKHNYLEDGNYMENKVLLDSKGIYSCTL